MKEEAAESGNTTYCSCHTFVSVYLLGDKQAHVKLGSSSEHAGEEGGREPQGNKPVCVCLVLLVQVCK